MKVLQVHELTLNNDFMMNRELILLRPEITFEIKLKSFDDFLKIVSFPALPTEP